MKCTKKLKNSNASLAKLRVILKDLYFALKTSNDELIKFYAGFPDPATLMAFYKEIIEDDAKVMRQWEGKKSKDCYDDIKPGRPHKLPL